MTLSDKAIDDLREILRDEFEREFTRDETVEVSTRVLTLIQRLLRPLPHDKKSGPTISRPGTTSSPKTLRCPITSPQFPSMTRYFLYCRKSTESEDRQILSIDSQRDELLHLAKRLGLQVAEILTEAKSAKAPGRPVFSSMMARLAHWGGTGDPLLEAPIVSLGIRRWRRAHQAMKTHGLEILTPAQSFRPQDDNKILLYIEFGMAEKYIDDDLSRNVKRAQQGQARTRQVATYGALSDTSTTKRPGP